MIMQISDKHFRLFLYNAKGESFCPLGCKDCKFLCWETELLHIIMNHRLDEAKNHLRGSFENLRKLFFAPANPYMIRRMGNLAILEAMYTKAKDRKNYVTGAARIVHALNWGFSMGFQKDPFPPLGP